MCVEVSTQPGLDYGASHGYIRGDYVSGNEALPIESDIEPVTVAYDMDFDSLVEIYVDAITKR